MTIFAVAVLTVNRYMRLVCVRKIRPGHHRKAQFIQTDGKLKFIKGKCYRRPYVADNALRKLNIEAKTAKEPGVIKLYRVPTDYLNIYLHMYKSKLECRCLLLCLYLTIIFHAMLNKLF